MNLADVVCILIILMFAVVGFKRGVIRSGVQLVGTIAVLILAFTFKDILANFLMKYLPFFNFAGVFNGISAINILFYELVSFVLIYVLMYCVLSILLNLSGLVEKILKMTIILAIPSKILGGILGLIEGLIMAFLVTFIMFHMSPTENIVAESKFAIILLERTPIMGRVAAGTTLALEDINEVLHDVEISKDREAANLRVLNTLIHYNIISSEDAQKLIDDKKLEFTDHVSLGG